jgi:hypothetical protein
VANLLQRAGLVTKTSNKRRGFEALPGARNYRFMREGVAGLLCDETRKLSLSPLPRRAGWPRGRADAHPAHRARSRTRPAA